MKHGKENNLPKRKVDKSSAVKKTSNPKARKRRRSSARFLRLSGRFSTGGDIAEEENEEENKEKLAEVYSKAIRLNAENKINAGNAWDLKLVENMDKLLGDDEDEVNHDDVPIVSATNDDKRVNFTKASCTLDASVKIYSYRVDDVHLTSYKFLANLNRTDNGKDDKDDHGAGRESDVDDDNFEDGLHSKKKSYATRDGKSSTVKTVETNVANLNISKLDSAYDIDPIFHKMSQKFDEGGAKGLLLNNLCVANDGCRIILDSKEDTNEEIPELSEEETTEMTEENAKHKEGMIDMTTLMAKFGESISSYSIESVAFVPQLEELRESYASLEAEGFVDAAKNIKKSKTNRYANDEDDEAAAEESIHREALERSTANPGGTSFLLGNTSIMIIGSGDHDDDNDDGVGFELHDDGLDDDNFDNFLAMDTHAEKYSSDSFRHSGTEDEFAMLTEDSNQAGVATFLNEICDGDVLGQGTQFTYFNMKALENLTSGNQWAGSAHWKKATTVKSKTTKKVTKNDTQDSKRKDQKRKKKDIQTASFIDLNACDNCLNELLNTKKGKGRKAKADPTLLSNASIQKYNKERNVLPRDAEIDMHKFTKLFMRPDSNLIPQRNKIQTENLNEKTVAFEPFDTTEYYDDGADYDDDGPGFELNDNDDTDDFVVKELEGVRKVGKIEIGHANVAKKVDVKRLKKDLWIELESKTAPQQTEVLSTENKSKSSTGDDLNESQTEEKDAPAITEKNVSFKDTVEKLGATEAQEDVSLAFYFICVLHLANEKGLKLENGEHGLQDFIISRDRDVVSTE